VVETPFPDRVETDGDCQRAAPHAERPSVTVDPEPDDAPQAGRDEEHRGDSVPAEAEIAKQNAATGSVGADDLTVSEEEPATTASAQGGERPRRHPVVDGGWNLESDKVETPTFEPQAQLGLFVGEKARVESSRAIHGRAAVQPDPAYVAACETSDRASARRLRPSFARADDDPRHARDPFVRRDCLDRRPEPSSLEFHVSVDKQNQIAVGSVETDIAGCRRRQTAARTQPHDLDREPTRELYRRVHRGGVNDDDLVDEVALCENRPEQRADRRRLVPCDHNRGHLRPCLTSLVRHRESHSRPTR